MAFPSASDLSFSRSEERWMEERLAALETSQGDVPCGHKEPTIPRAHRGALPPGMSEEDEARSDDGSPLPDEDGPPPPVKVQHKRPRAR